MAVNYSPKLPSDSGSTPLQEYPSPKKALAVHSKENGSVSSVISFTHDTTALEVSAVGGGAVIRWIQTSDTTASVISGASGANFDHFISANTTRRFVIPIESQGIGQSSIVGANRLNGLYQRVAYKTVGVASIMTSEF